MDFIWQYSRFYGNKLGECENYHRSGEGYIALILLFEVTENICKSILGDYDSSFYNVIEKLYDDRIITYQEKLFLSTDTNSVRKIRNLFAHANLMGINIVREENGRDVYYPLTEEDSCILLYDIISPVLFNVLLDIIKSHFIGTISVNFECKLEELDIRIVELSATEILKQMGIPDEYISKMESIVDENTLKIMADNGTNVNVLSMILKGLLDDEKNGVETEMLFICYPKCSTCQKAKKWLDEHNIEYTERHIVDANPSYDELMKWYGKSGLPLKKFFNTSGLIYKEMQLKDKLPTMSEEEQLQLLATNGMLVKRPLVVNDDTVLVGFKEAEWLEKLN